MWNALTDWMEQKNRHVGDIVIRVVYGLLVATWIFYALLAWDNWWLQVFGLVAFVVFAGGWTYRSLVEYEIGPQERMVAIVFGVPTAVYVLWNDEKGQAEGTRTGLWRTGYAFLPWPFAKAVRFSTRQLEIDFTADLVMTRAKPVEQGQTHSEIDRADMVVDATVYLSWGSGKDLVESFRRLNVRDPNDRGQLREFYRHAVTDAIRKVAASEGWHWERLMGDRDRFEFEVFWHLQDPESPFVQTGLFAARPEGEPEPPPNVTTQRRETTHRADLRVSVRFADPELQKKYSAIQEALFDREAAKRRADAEAYREKQVGIARAEAKKREFEIRKQKDPTGMYSAAEAWKESKGSTNMFLVPEAVWNVLTALARWLGKGGPPESGPATGGGGPPPQGPST